MKLYYLNLNLTFTKTKVIFKKFNITTIDILKGIYLIGFNLPITTASNYDSKGVITLDISGINIVYTYNIHKNNPGNVLNTNIYIIQTSGKLSISLRGSGLEFNRGIADKYIIIYKLFDQLP